MNNSYLYHHGILGQRWGVRRYQNKDGSLTAAGRRHYGYGSEHTGSQTDDVITDRHSYSDRGDSHRNLKTALKIGAAAAATGLAIYGGYKLAKSGKLDGIADKIGIGRKKATEMLSGDSDTIKIGDTIKEAADSIYKSTGRDVTEGYIKMSDLSDVKTIGGLKIRNTPLSVDDMIANAYEGGIHGGTIVNPHRGEIKYKNNCTRCALNAVLQYFGIDGTARGDAGEGDFLDSVMRNVFKDRSQRDGQMKMLTGSSVVFAKSKEDAAKMLVKRFGNNGVGVIGVDYKNSSGGHAFNFEIVNGVVRFFDTQSAFSDVNVDPDRFWSKIDPNGELNIGMVDPRTVEINVKGLLGYSQ